MSETGRRDAPAPQGDPKTVAVYFSCEADFLHIGTAEQPLYRFLREIPSSLAESEVGRVEGAVRAYLAGPTDKEVSSGFFSASNGALADTLAGVGVEAGIATLDFSSGFASRSGNLGTSTASAVFFHEIQRTVFQFDYVSDLVLTLDGDCESFWRVFESTICQTFKR